MYRCTLPGPQCLLILPPLPPDIDECGLYQGRAGSKLCVHECVNTPGAYHCVCPRGYLLESQPNTCKGEQCVNLYGGFTCVRPECPRAKMNATYVKVSGHQCERTPCPVGSSGCLDAPHSVSFHYIPLQSQLPVPRVLFTMTAPRSQADSQRFTLTRGKGPRGLEVRQAGRHRAGAAAHQARERPGRDPGGRGDGGDVRGGAAGPTRLHRHNLRLAVHLLGSPCAQLVHRRVNPGSAALCRMYGSGK
ncbi:unnamed protein product [Ranitomeya imitator]|uniref:EGF-like domain-containing protein n=1 Tax=Ranitomeya imitator TaxID=111125 RepID=A0ABN9M8G6_9NEOB|nr:unnamed protein product [Ranitomeya imitator]